MEGSYMEGSYIVDTLNSYLKSLKSTQNLKDYEVTFSEPYLIEGYHLTKHGFVVEHQITIRSQERKQVLSTKWFIRRLAGPHRSRRIIHKFAKQFLRGEHQPVELSFQPVLPIRYFPITIDVSKI